LRRTLPLVAVIGGFVVAFLVWIGNEKTVARRLFDRYSVENTSENGLSSAFRYLQLTGHRVTRFGRPVRTGLVAAKGVVFRIGGYRPWLIVSDEDTEEKKSDKNKSKNKSKNKKEDKVARPKWRRTVPLISADEDSWIRGGGRLVIGVDADGSSLELRDVSAKVATKTFPLWPGIDTIAPPNPRAFLSSAVPPRMTTLYAAAGEAAMVREAIGAGDVIITAVPEVFQNDVLGRKNHLELLTAMAGGRPVYFDETIHGLGSGEGALDLLRDWGLGPFLLLAAATGVLVFWRKAKRIGAPEDDHRETRSEAVDLVRSLGALYRKSMTDADALAAYRETLVRTVAANTGLRGEALYRRVGELTRGDTAAGETRLSAARLRRHLKAINEGFRSLERRRAVRASGEIDANHR
jgi:hypothetical protein